MPTAESWIYPTPNGLFCEPGGFYIDPPQAVDRALITHGHSDHARPGHHHVLATHETIEIMKIRHGAQSQVQYQVAPYRQPLELNGVTASFIPAGHILGSAQIVLAYNAMRVVISGDYKRAPDPTCQPFELMPCDVFVTEATFALPVFRHGPAEREIERLSRSLQRQPERTHLVGAYSLGKCQRVIKLVRNAGYDLPIYLHGAHIALTRLYEQLGQNLGDLRAVADADRGDLKGAIVLCPPSALTDRWSQRFGDPLTAFASGWMQVRGRAHQRNVELPLVISDHADWPALLETIMQTGAAETWVTHGRDDALVYQLGKLGRNARALALVGRDDEAE